MLLFYYQIVCVRWMCLFIFFFVHHQKKITLFSCLVFIFFHDSINNGSFITNLLLFSDTSVATVNISCKLNTLFLLFKLHKREFYDKLVLSIVIFAISGSAGRFNVCIAAPQIEMPGMEMLLVWFPDSGLIK